MHIRFRDKHGGPTARGQASPGQRPGSVKKDEASPERAVPFAPPFQGSDFLKGQTQGVALGWHICAPLVLQTSPLSRNRISIEGTADLIHEKHERHERGRSGCFALFVLVLFFVFFVDSIFS